MVKKTLFGMLILLIGAFAVFTACKQGASNVVKPLEIYTVTFVTNGGGALPQQNVPEGGRATAPQDPIRDGWTFVGWFTDNGTFNNQWRFSYPVSGHTTLYGKWAQNAPGTYTVYFNSNGGSPVGQVAVPANGKVPAPQPPTKAGHAFAGWYSDADLTTEWNFSTGIVSGTLTLFAKWTLTATGTYTVYFNSNGGSAVDFKSVTAGGHVPEPAVPTRAGYTFVGWYIDNNTFNTQWNFSVDEVIGPLTLHAKWTQNGVTPGTFTVTFNSNGGSNVPTQTVSSGGTATRPPNPTKSNSTFVNWYSDTGLSAVYSFSTPVTQNITLHAKWLTSGTPTNPVGPNLPAASAHLIFIGPAITDVDASGMRVSPNGDSSAAIMKQYGGEWALDRGSSDFIFWFIDNTTVKSAANVVLEIKYYDDMAGSFGIQYRSATEAFQGVGSVQKTGSGQYQTAWVPLTNCGFGLSLQQNQGAQFRFGSGAIIKSVHIIIGELPDVTIAPPPAADFFAPQTNLNNIIGKGIAGYQSWFKADTGHHWSRSGQKPGKNNVNVEMWPHTADYAANGATLYSTNFANLGGGGQSVIFNSRDREVILTHFQWMEEYGIDCAAVQRFYGDWPGGLSTARSHLMEIKDAAEATGRSFYVMYDFSGWPNGSKTVKEIQEEWINNVEKPGIASSTSYAHAENKPVAFIWGLGPGAENNWVPDNIAVQLAEWFRNRGYFVIGGSVDNPNSWAGSSSAHQAAYAAFDMLMPWPVGRYGGSYASAKSWMDSNFPALQTFCNGHPRWWAGNQPIRIMGGIYTGGGWTNLGNGGNPNDPPKNAGQPMWDQIRALLGGSYKPDTFYICMFDEYDESTAIMKAGSDYFDIPTDQWFLTLSTDGWWLSHDYYLRVAQAGIAIIKNPNAIVPTDIDLPHSLGPLYYRNSFEKRDGWRNVTNVTQAQQAQDVDIPGVRLKVPDLALDPGLRNPGAVAKGSGASLTTNAAIKAAGKSGLWVFHLAGTGNGSAYYKIGDVKINANAALQLKYSLKPLDAGGSNVFVDILFADGSLLSESNNSVIAQRGTVGQWTDVTVTGIPANKAISGVVVGYSGNGAFSAHVDDIIIQKP